VRGDHGPTCASGARAEARAECDCGASERPYRARVLEEVDERGQRLVEVQVDGPLTASEAVSLAITLQELAREEGQRWARKNARRKR